MACLDTLWTRESNWNPRAVGDRTSTGRAYGIPQIKRMHETNPLRQVDRGLAYIAHRYGTACGALAHSDALGWY